MNTSNFCETLSPLLHTIGQMINIFKISLPLILIVLGIFDIGKAVISSKSDDVKKNMKHFVLRIIVSILIFFIPIICLTLFNFIGEFSAIRKNSGLDFDVCYSCLFNPNKDDCTDAVEIAMEEGKEIY